MTKVSSPTLSNSVVLPDFIQAISDDYKSQVAHVFVLHGNIYDFCDNAGNNSDVQEMFVATFDDNFQKELSKSIQNDNNGINDGASTANRTKIILTYNLSQGLEYPHNQSFTMLKEVFVAELGADKVTDQFMMPKSPGKLIEFMNMWFAISKKKKIANFSAKKQGIAVQKELVITWLISDADALFPQGDISNLGPDRLPIVSVRQWAQDKWIGAGNRIILMTRHASDLHDSIRSEISAVHLIRKPNLEERKQYILGFDETIKKQAKANGGSLVVGKNTSVTKIEWADDFGPSQCAIQSAGMNRKQLRDIFLKTWMTSEKVGYDAVRDRKQRALQDEYQGMIDFKEPEFGFEEIGGHDAFKKFCKQQIIIPLQSGDKRTCARGGLLLGPPGCQPAGSKVLMVDGSWKNVEDIKVGDLVVSPQNDNTVISSKVLETVEYDNHDTYKVSTKGRSVKSYLCADNHIVPFDYLSRPRKNGVRQSRVYRYAEAQAKDIKNVGKNCKKVIHTSPPVELPEQKFTIHPYLLGAVIGDGCVTKSISFTGSRKIINKLKTLVAITGKSEYKKGNSLGVYLVKETGDLFRSSEIYGRNSYTHFIPDNYKLGSIKQRLELLAGLIDTDGSVDSYTSCSEQLIKDFVYLVHSVGGFANYKSRITYSQNGTPCYSYRAHYAFAEKRPSLVYKYKDQGKRNMKWKNPRNRDFIVTKTGKKETVYGFVLDSPSELYVTDDWLVTHNTGKSSLAWALAKEAKMNYLIVDLSKVFGSLVGETEKNMRKLLEAIESAAPCIVFVDELDSVLSAGRTSSGDSGTSGRVFNSFMTFMSDPGRAGRIVVLAATNRPDLLDAALIRAGRFDAKIAILPPARGDVRGRKAILKALVTKHKVQFGADLAPTMGNKEDGLGRLLEDDVRIWTGAEIEVVMKKAISTAAFANRLDEDGQKDYTITLEDWNHAMDVIIPNTNEVEFQTKLALLFTDDLDFVPDGYQDMAKDKDTLRKELGINVNRDGDD